MSVPSVYDLPNAITLSTSRVSKLRTPAFLRFRILSKLWGHQALIAVLAMFAWASDLAAADRSTVSFDTPLVVAAEAIELASAPYRVSVPGNRLVSVQVRLSTHVPFALHGKVEELSVRIRSTSRAMRVVDHWPRTEAVSGVMGNIDVTSLDHTKQHFSLQALGGAPGVGSAAVVAGKDASQTTQRQFAEKPKLSTHIASGTMDRATGVYFQLRPSAEQTLEGERDFWMLCEVASDWKADLLDVTATASGVEGTRSRGVELGTKRFTIAIYQAANLKAYQQAQSFVQYEQKLRQSAIRFRETIERRNTPTPIHKLAQSLDWVEPKISPSWLEYVLYDPNVTYIDDKTAELPVDVRVAILDYIDHKQAMLQLAQLR